MIATRSGLLAAIAVMMAAAAARAEDTAVAAARPLAHGAHDHAHHPAADHRHGPEVDPAAGERAHVHPDHVDHHDPYAAVLGGHHHGARALSVSLGTVAADYEMHLYRGRYQGLTAEVGAGFGRFALAASVSAYRLERNGLRETGVGDAMLHAHVSLLHRGAWAGGLGAMVSAPTGSVRAGLGMGHPMVMADAWLGWRRGRVALSGSVGYGRSLGGAGAHADHGGAWPLVGVMNASELTHAAGATVALRPRVGLGVSAAGALPIGDGAARLVGGVRGLWAIRSTLATVDLQRGVVGDPFGTRVIAAATVRFE